MAVEMTNNSEKLINLLMTCIPDDESMCELFTTSTTPITYQHAYIILERDLVDHAYMVINSNITEDEMFKAIEYFIKSEKIKTYTYKILLDYITKIKSFDDDKKNIINGLISNISNTDMQLFMQNWINEQ